MPNESSTTLSHAEAQSSALDRPLTITRFRDPFAASMRALPTSLRELVPLILKTSASDKSGLPLLKLAQFGGIKTPKGSLRHDGNVLAIEGVEGDHDAGTMPVADAAEMLRAEGVAALIYTTPSHTLERPRWRVLCPTSAPMAPTDRERLCACLNGILGGVLAGESFTLSQSYYFGSVRQQPTCQVELIEGTPLDLVPPDASLCGPMGKDGKAYRPAGQQPATEAPDDDGPDAQADWETIGSEPDWESVASALDAIPEAARAERETYWRPIGMALHHAAGGSEQGFEAWDGWSRVCSNYNATDQQRVWQSFGRRTGKRTTLGTLYHLAKQHGWKPKAGNGLSNLDGFKFTEDNVAKAFAQRHRGELQYDHDAGQWYHWTGTRWQLQGTRLAFHWCRTICRDIRLAGVKTSAAHTLAKAATAAAVERFATSDPSLAVTSEVWDRNPWLLGTPGGTVELHTGELRPARPADRITKQTDAAPSDAAGCPQWLAFLAEVTSDDAGLIRFLQQWCGYCLTGNTKEQALLFIYGPGGNGKSVFLNTLTGILGDYCRTAGMEVFSASKGDRHPQELARLKGARMVCANETEEGKAWAEVRIKQLTGGDTITARFMRQNDFEFRPEFKLVVIGNHKPALHNVDAAARRRFNVVPFVHKPANPDRELEAKLREEWPGILAWMIAGCLNWQAHGLQRPDVVANATAEYFEDQDTFGQWLTEECETGREFAAANACLLDSWTWFAGARGETALARTKGFPDALRARGFKSIKDTMGIRGRGFQGLRLRQPQEGDL